MPQEIINATTTIFAGSFAFLVYLHQKASFKRDAALLILQEIRFAEAQIKRYNPVVGYQFYEKLLPTDSWNKNIHLFVNDFEESQIDAISLFYSKAHYLDEVISKISELVLANPSTVNPGVVQSAIQQQQQQQMPAQQILDVISFGVKVDAIHNSVVGQRLRELSKQKKFYFL